MWKEHEAFGEQMCNAIIHVPILAITEIGRINGYLTTKLGLNSKKMGTAVKKADEAAANKKMFKDCMMKIQERFNFFPE